MLKKLRRAPTGVDQWIECRPVACNSKVADLIPSQGTCLGCGPGPQLGVGESNRLMYLLHIDVSLPLSLLFPLSKNEINKILKKKTRRELNC